MQKEKKNIFIIGSSAKEYSLAQKFSKLSEVDKIFVAPGNDAMKEFATVVDIRETNVQELLEFALENAIDLTVASSETAIKSDISSLFQNNGQMIFAPTQASANICISKSAGKKFMYQNRILCPKFAVFDKLQMALDYVNKSNMPIVVKADEYQDNNGVLVCNCASIAKRFIEDLFEQGEKKVVIEDFIFGHEFSFYVITDGYHALPLGGVATYKRELDGEGGLITPGMGCYTPDYKISRKTEEKIMHQIIYPALNSLAKHHNPYVGILGVDLIMNDNEQLFAIEFNSFLQTPDCQAILSVLNENIYHLFQACVIGSFADDYEMIDIQDFYAASCVLLGKKEDAIIEDLDNLDEDTDVAYFGAKKNKYLEYETIKGRNLVITKKAKVLSRAVDTLYDEISIIDFEGLKYRKDIGKI